MKKCHCLSFVAKDDFLVLTTDASTSVVGLCLFKTTNSVCLSENGIKKMVERLGIVSINSHTLNNAERKYSELEKELLGIVRAKVSNRHYILLSKQNLLIPIDHANLVSIKKFLMTENRHLKWFEVLADVEYQMAHILGALNVIANFLSRTEKTETAKPKNALLGELYGRNIVNEIRKKTSEEDSFFSYKKSHERDEYVHPGF
jgi:RNase H-like domain found in reverse transcriptase